LSAPYEISCIVKSFPSIAGRDDRSFAAKGPKKVKNDTSVYPGRLGSTEMTGIRQASAEDLPRMQEIAIMAWSPIYALHEHLMGRQLFNRLYPNWKAEKGSQVSSHFKRYPQWAFVIEEGREVVGFLTYFLDEEKKIGEIGNNAVHPDHQGKGLGEAMHREALRRFRERGMLYAKVETGLDDSHIPARRAYEKLGFKQVFRFVEYFMKL